MTIRTTLMAAASAALVLAAGAVSADEARLKPDEQLRPGPTDRPAAKGMGPEVDPTLDSPSSAEQQDVIYTCDASGKEQVVVIGTEESGDPQLPAAGAGAQPKAAQPAGQDCPAPNLQVEGKATGDTLTKGTTAPP